MPKINVRNQNKHKSRLEILKTWMSSFVMTVGVVVAVVVLVPKSPVALIENIQIFENVIAYQVNVTDEDDALDLSSLHISIDNQLETHKAPLNLGLNVGFFDNLSPGTEYQISVYGSKGFGLERLDSLVVRTKDQPGGAILGYEILGTSPHGLDYEVDILINDTEGIYTDVRLRYGFLYPDEDIDQLIYDVIPILEQRNSIEIFDVPIYNSIVYLILEGYDGTTYLKLDELVFHVPFHLENSIYVESISKDEIKLNLYPDYYFTENISYQMNVFRNQTLVESKVISSSDMAHYGIPIIISRLKQLTDYKIVISATYQNPRTLRRETQIIFEETIKTLGDYTITYEITEFDTYYEIYLHLNDPNHYFQIPFYTIYESVDEQLIYIASNQFGFTPDVNGKYVIFNIPKPAVIKYQLIIGVRNQNDFTIQDIIYDQMIKS